MKLLKQTILTIIIAITAASCREELPTDNETIFARKVVTDVCSNMLDFVISDISIADKASAWLYASDEEARYAIEDKYFSKIAPRTKDNKITIITTSGAEIELSHNNKPIDDVGAEWSISYRVATTEKLHIKNIDGAKWECSIKRTDDKLTHTTTIEKRDIDFYIADNFDAYSNIAYENSPVAGQHIYNTAPLVYNGIFETAYAYPIENCLHTSEGEITIELLDENNTAIEGDDIKLQFKSNKDNYYDYNPSITFRGNTFILFDPYSYYY